MNVMVGDLVAFGGETASNGGDWPITLAGARLDGAGRAGIRITEIWAVDATGGGTLYGAGPWPPGSAPELGELEAVDGYQLEPGGTVAFRFVLAVVDEGRFLLDELVVDYRYLGASHTAVGHNSLIVCSPPVVEGCLR